MAAIVRQYRASMPIRELALSIVRSVPGHKNFRGQVSALHNWVVRNIQYIRDIDGLETLQTPIKTLEYRQGDCDDQSILMASLLRAVGFPARFVAVKVNPFGPFVHVFSEANLGTVWFPLETTERWGPGVRPPRIADKMVENI
jgi:transglutaminase-like putative cysteine protease